MSNNDTKTLFDRAVPCDIASERALLACILLDSSLYSVLDPLEKNSFFLEKNEALWRAMEHLIQRGDSVDLVTVSHAMEELKTTELIGGTAYIVGLLTETPTLSNVATYYKTVVEMSVRRRLLMSSTRIAELAFNSEGRTAEELISKSLEQISSIGVTTSGGASLFGDLITDLEKNVETIFSEDVVRGIPTGLADLDQITGGLQRSDLWIVAGDASIGKTSFAMGVLTSAGSHNFASLFFSLETTKERLMERWASILTDKSLREIRRMPLKDKIHLLEKIRIAQDYKIFVDTRPQDTGTIRSEIARFERKIGKLDLVIVDYSRLLRDKVKGDNEVLRVEQISRNLKNAAKEFDLTVVLIHGLVRSAFGKRPSLADLGWSHQMGYDVDVCLLPWYKRDRVDKTAEIYIGKQRNGASNIGVPCVFDNEKTVWRSIARSTAGQQERFV